MSTTRKNLKSSPTMTYYVRASQDIFNHKPYILQYEATMLYNFDKKLRKLGIDAEDYTTSLLRYLKQWIKSKKWDTLPVKTFVGNWALKLYQDEIGARQFEYINADQALYRTLVMQEYEVLKYYKHFNCKSYKEAIDAMSMKLSGLWFDIQDYRIGKKVHQEAIDLYHDMYGEWIVI